MTLVSLLRFYPRYAMPSFSTVPLTLLISVYVIQFYEKLGAPLSMLALFQALARGFDVVTDPTMSYLTDSWRGKRGRRRLVVEGEKKAKGRQRLSCRHWVYTRRTTVMGSHALTFKQEVLRPIRSSYQAAASLL